MSSHDCMRGLIVVVAMFGLSGCESEADHARWKEQEKAEVEKLREDNARRMLAPQWYKKSLRQECYWSGNTPYAWNQSDLRYGLTFLALIPIAFISYSFATSQNETIFESGVAMILIFIGNEVLCLLLRIASWLVVSVFVGDYYVPYTLIACLVYLAYLVLTPLVYLLRSLDGTKQVMHAVAQGTVSVARPTRKRLVTVAIRALVVAIITTIGSQLGGWVGGIVAVVISSIITSFVGDHHHHDV